MATATNVTAGKPNTSGSIFVAPIDTTLPTNATATLASGFAQLGYVSEDGVTNTNTPDSEDIKSWGGDTVLSLQTEKTDEFQLTLIEALNENVLEVVYGSNNVTGTLATGISVTANSDEPEERAWVIDMILRGGALKRIVIPDAKVSEIGDIVYKDDEAVGYELTLKALPDSNGNSHYEYILAADDSE